MGSVVAYNKKIKSKLLDIETELLDRYGTVSRECVQAMAENTAEIFAADLTAATTGAAGPEAHEGKKAGTMFLALVFKGKLKIIELQKNYGRELNRYYASQIILFEIYKLIKGSEEN